MSANNKVLTDSASGASGSLTVRALTIGKDRKPAGIYTAATAPWVEGKGSVIVRP